MFRAAHPSSSGALNFICSLWFTYTCGDRPLSYSDLTTAGHHMCMWTRGCKYSLELLMMSGMRSKHVEPSINVGIINSITRLRLVGYFYWFILRCTNPWILKIFCLYWKVLFVPTAFRSLRLFGRVKIPLQFYGVSSYALTNHSVTALVDSRFFKKSLEQHQ